jgi:hypothetical protein
MYHTVPLSSIFAHFTADVSVSTEQAKGNKKKSRESELRALSTLTVARD